ncbi:MAG: DMT family transporter [Bacteroidales bacterium]|nr:DMT family transporter [Bacteroidales bacterium]
MFFGEFLSIIVALSWTATALFAEVGSKRMGSLPFNAIRMALSLCFLALTLWLTLGTPWPRYADTSTWLWLLLSGVVGYVIGDYCLMQGYIVIGSRFGQLFMTLSAPTAAILGRLFIGEKMGGLAIAGMVITLSGIAISVLSKQDSDNPKSNTHSNLHLKLPIRGVMYAAMAGICQGAGLVLSKIGLEHYDAALSIHNIDVSSATKGALLPIPLNLTIPFASTMIRGIMGFAGFMLLLMLSKNGASKLRKAIGDRKAFWCALASMLFGPFLGVSLSLMATLYTSTGIAQTLFSLTPVLIIAPAALLFHQKVTLREVIGAIISVTGVCLFFV